MKLAIEIVIALGIVGMIYSMVVQQFNTCKIPGEDE
jgi:hypothetical protein